MAEYSNHTVWLKKCVILKEDKEGIDSIDTIVLWYDLFYFCSSCIEVKQIKNGSIPSNWPKWAQKYR